MPDLIVNNYTSQAITYFKYLGTNINNINSMDSVINLKNSVANIEYITLLNFFNFKLLFMRRNLPCAWVIRPLLSYKCKMWSITKGDEEKLMTFKEKILRRIYGIISENKEYRMRTNKKIYQVYLKPIIKSFIRGKRLEWAGHVWSPMA